MYFLLKFLWFLNFLFYIFVVFVISVSIVKKGDFSIVKKWDFIEEKIDKYTDPIYDFVDKLGFNIPYKYKALYLLFYPFVVTLVLSTLWAVYLQLFYDPAPKFKSNL